MSAGLLLAGCGGQDDAAAAEPSPSATASSVPSTSTPKSTPGSTPSASAEPGDLRTTTTSTEAPVPSGGPTEAREFPLPPGVQVKGPAPQSRSWQFDITTKDTDGVLAFYRKALAAQGYKVRNDVTHRVGDEVVTYDLTFSGPAEGYLVADPGADDVFVVVQSLPRTQD